MIDTTFTCIDCKATKPAQDFAWKKRGRWAVAPDSRIKTGTKRRCLECRSFREIVFSAGFRICSECGEVKKESCFCKTKTTGWYSPKCRPCAAKVCMARKDAQRSFLTVSFCYRCKTEKPCDQFDVSQSDRFRMRRKLYCRECSTEREAEGVNTILGKFTNAKAIAESRGIAWELTLDEYKLLRSKPCHYCGHPLNKSGIGMDRKDSLDRSYTASNSVACCWECNSSKGRLFSAEEMERFIGPAIRAAKDARATQQYPFRPIGAWAHRKKRKSNDDSQQPTSP